MTPKKKKVTKKMLSGAIHDLFEKSRKTRAEKGATMSGGSTSVPKKKQVGAPSNPVRCRYDEKDGLVYWEDEKKKKSYRQSMMDDWIIDLGKDGELMGVENIRTDLILKDLKAISYTDLRAMWDESMKEAEVDVKNTFLNLGFTKKVPEDMKEPIVKYVLYATCIDNFEHKLQELEESK